MRILLIAPPWLRVPPIAYGGIEWVVSGLADGLVDAGNEVTLIAPGGSTTRAQLETVFDGPKFQSLGDSRIETIQALSAYYLRGDFDVVHDHTAAVGPALGSMTTGPPVVHTLHHVWDEAQIQLARLTSPPLHLVAISNDQARRAPDDISITAVVHNGIPVERYPFVTEKDDYLLWIGRASPDKGPGVAIDVAARTGRRLVIAVKINQRDEREHWAEVVVPLIEASPVPIEVVSNPGHERKAELMGRAAAVILPIQWAEPFGLVMPETNACGTPVVVYGIGAAPEVIADGTSGFVVPPGDVDAFCAAVDRVDEIDPIACRDHVVEHFSAQRMVAGYERVYEAVTTIDLRSDSAVVLRP